MHPWTFAITMPFVEGRHRVTVRDLPEAITSGVTEADALENAVDAIDVAVSFRMKRGEPLPLRSAPLDGDRVVTLPARSAAKAAVYEAWTEAGISKAELARRMGRDIVEVRRILQPGHGTKLDQLEEAAKALGLQFTIGLAPIAGGHA